MFFFHDCYPFKLYGTVKRNLTTKAQMLTMEKEQENHLHKVSQGEI